jgi:hypothetical protein
MVAKRNPAHAVQCVLLACDDLMWKEIRMEYQLTCPDCGSVVRVEQNQIEGTIEKGGHKTIGAEDSAVCPNPKCQRRFTQPEIDDWATWA